MAIESTHINLVPNWAQAGTSAEFENLLIEVEERLHAAPNIKAFWGIGDSHLDNVIGFAVEYAAGTRDFFLAQDQGTITFLADGNLALLSDRSA